MLYSQGIFILVSEIWLPNTPKNGGHLYSVSRACAPNIFSGSLELEGFHR